ncbi:DUF4240 domain-containing protein [Nakamurella flava]|uniref:DUF4240 domain-containing protein n=1 Tax=Nakamurella flava TaxID=2576308 RepID=A0A4U6QGM6_9ACTN|nr:DUF4240 domain-containing protein [Nakamurella flava]TKV59179.1 DUF4240 domain-containing protein [Nakamurella flava]
MDEDGFWRLVDEARAGSSALDESTVGRLRVLLDGLSPRSTLDAVRIHDELVRRAYTWDLWAAGYLVGGGMSDDSFWDFRQWLIAMGRATYERVLADPDALVDVSTDMEEIDSGLGEIYGYEFVQAAERKQLEVPTGEAGSDEPRGEEFPEDDDDWFAEHFPRLWAAVRA